MLRPRKHCKIGAEREATLTQRTCPDTRSSLVALPAEVQSIITSYLVQFRDLNHLCCTCKTLSAIVLPTLYHTIELKVPLQWSRLPSLEHLLASSSEGLKYTKCLRIVTKQYPRKDNAYTNLDAVQETGEEDVSENDRESGDEEESMTEVESDAAEQEERGEDDYGCFRVYNPHISASEALNAFIRVLIVKLPSQQLHTFWWEHACSLSALTLSVVLKHQGTSIHTLNFRQHTGSWRKADLAKLSIGGLTTLGIADAGTGGSWPIELLARNYQNLRHLRLGCEVGFAAEYAKQGFHHTHTFDRFDYTETFAKLMNEKVAALDESSTSVVQLESLSLIGLDLRAFTTGSIKRFIGLESLSTLALESCPRLEAIFPLLTGAGAGGRKAKSSLPLQRLTIRHEDTSNEFLLELEKFLLSLKPLTHLHVLLEGRYSGAVHIRKVLQIHGKCLRSLIWDERTLARIEVQEDTVLVDDDHRTLAVVAKHCPGLKALGISLAWDDIVKSGENHNKITSSFSRLSQLRTLNVRNLPRATTSKNWLPNDYMMNGLATMLLNIITRKMRIEQTPVLRTLAIGASTYGNVRVGTGHYTPNNTSTFLQPRIYHIQYDCRYRNSPFPTLHLIARGTPADAWGEADDLDIFTPYWLDGAPRDQTYD